MQTSHYYIADKLERLHKRMTELIVEQMHIAMPERMTTYFITRKNIIDWCKFFRGEIECPDLENLQDWQIQEILIITNKMWKKLNERKR